MEGTTRAGQTALAPSPAAPKTQVATITLTYRTSWPEAYVHYSVDGKEWTPLPGRRMEHAEREWLLACVRACMGTLLERQSLVQSPGLGMTGSCSHACMHCAARRAYCSSG